METFSALLAICAGNSPVPGEFPTQWPVTRSFDVFFDLSLNKRLSKQWWGWWFETQSCPLWRHCNVGDMPHYISLRRWPGVFSWCRCCNHCWVCTGGRPSLLLSGFTYRMHSGKWWRHDMETLSALLAICEGNPPMAGGIWQSSC